jgi:integrase
VSEHFRIGKWFLDKRPNSPSWCVCWFDPATRQTRRASLRTADFQVAKIRLAEHVTKHETLKSVDPEGVSLEAILIRYWEEHGKAIPSAEQARFALAKWSDHFCGATVSRLTPQAQETFVAALRANGYQPSYISRILSVGRAALMRAWKRGELTSVPFIADVKRDPEQEAERFRDLDMDEVARLLREAAAVPHLLSFCMISLNTLARPDAVLDLSPAQVDIKFPISDTLLPWVEQCEGTNYVLYHGKPVASVKKSFGKAVVGAGLKDVSPYCLRHTMATELRARGVSEWEAMGMLGHKSPARTTERYAKFRPDYPSGAARAIDAYFTDLGAAFGDLSDLILNPVRASSVLVPKHSFPQSLGNVVGATGIEPVTPAMSTQCSYR